MLYDDCFYYLLWFKLFLGALFERAIWQALGVLVKAFRKNGKTQVCNFSRKFQLIDMHSRNLLNFNLIQALSSIISWFWVNGIVSGWHTIQWVTSKSMTSSNGACEVSVSDKFYWYSSITTSIVRWWEKAAASVVISLLQNERHENPGVLRESIPWNEETKGR